jgi:FtsZ-binding cell division protein ZapB
MATEAEILAAITTWQAKKSELGALKDERDRMVTARQQIVVTLDTLATNIQRLQGEIDVAKANLKALL